jgi:hypothetical protein
MSRPFWKQVGFWALLILVLAALLISSPVRTEFHKSRLQSLKARKARLLGNFPSGLDKFWWYVTGSPISGTELDQAIRNHEDALVKLRFLQREKLPAQMVAACPETKETLAALQTDCPWYYAETISTNLVFTACPKMMDRWRKRAEELRW